MYVVGLRLRLDSICVTTNVTVEDIIMGETIRSAVDRHAAYEVAYEKLMADSAISSRDKELFRRMTTGGESAEKVAADIGVSVKVANEIKASMMKQFRQLIEQTTDVDVRPSDATHEKSHVQVRCSCANGEVVGRWRILAMLGSGGSGEVYRVAHEDSGDVAALKIFLERPDVSASKTAAARGRFLREIDALRSLDVKYFPKFIGTGEWENRPYIVMEELQKFTLPSEDKDVARFLIDLCRAVGALHKLGYVHRDLKPGNILRRGDGSYVLIDLGLVKRIDDSGNATGPSLSIVDGHVIGVGTVGYSAPEQFNEAKASIQSDVHALGMIINACFKDRMPDAWSDIVQKATSSIPSQRYKSVKDLVVAIEKRKKYMPLTEMEERERRSKARWKWIGRYAWVVGSLAGTMTLATLLYALIKKYVVTAPAT